MANTISRSLHDLGLSAWFGGTLANAVALNPASSEAATASTTGAVANAGWDRWTPVNAAAIGAHLVGSVGQLVGNTERMKLQKGVGSMAVVKTTVTVAALGVTAYSRMLGKKVSQNRAVSAESGTEPSAATPPEVAKAQRQLDALQWAVPALTGVLVVVSAFAGEQQRPEKVHGGVKARIGSQG
jgi:hypothetical protein